MTASPKPVTSHEHLVSPSWPAIPEHQRRALPGDKWCGWARPGSRRLGSPRRHGRSLSEQSLGKHLGRPRLRTMPTATPAPPFTLQSSQGLPSRCLRGEVPASGRGGRRRGQRKRPTPRSSAVTPAAWLSPRSRLWDCRAPPPCSS